MEGKLVFEVIINKEGRPTSPRVVSPVPMPSLCYAALEALKESRYTPATANGVPIEFLIAVTARFDSER
jgi:TonB family protein